MQSVTDADEKSLPAMLQICAYCACLWAAGHLCRHLRISAAIGEIVMGVALGPAVLDIVPYAAVFELAGVFGVTFMCFESGLHGMARALTSSRKRASLYAQLTDACHCTLRLPRCRVF